MTNPIDEIDDDDSEFELAEFDIEKIKSKIPTYSSKKLCEMIVCDRYFNCYKDMAEFCMEELAARRIKGDDFKFEEFINESMKELPVLDFNVPDIGTVLRGLIGQAGKR